MRFFFNQIASRGEGPEYSVSADPKEGGFAVDANSYASALSEFLYCNGIAAANFTRIDDGEEASHTANADGAITARMEG